MEMNIESQQLVYLFVSGGRLCEGNHGNTSLLLVSDGLTTKAAKPS